MANKVIITCAVTGAGDTVGKHPAIPVTPEQIASSCLDAAKAGAAESFGGSRNATSPASVSSASSATV